MLTVSHAVQKETVFASLALIFQRKVSDCKEKQQWKSWMESKAKQPKPPPTHYFSLPRNRQHPTHNITHFMELS